MLAKAYSTLSLRRRRHYLSRIIVIILCVCLFLQIKYNIFNILSERILINNTSRANLSFNKPILNCFGDPLEKWCQDEMNLCNSCLIVYNNLFAITHSVILQPEFAKGKRIGGENIQDVINQAEQDEYFHFDKNFIKLPCDIPQLNGKLSNGHLSNIFSSVTSYQTHSNTQIIEETTIAVNRQDYVNFYHTMTDLYTVYLLCRFFQRDPKSVRILFLDAHPKGNLDALWSQLFHSYTRLGHLKNVSAIFYRELIWSQLQSKSEIDIQQNRRTAPSFFFDFREHVLKQFNTNYQINQQLNCQSLNIFFLVRHDYIAHPRNPSGKITRQLSNEKQILHDLKIRFSKYPSINFSSNHFEQLTIEEQLNTIVQTDLLIGMHGAGLTHVLFMKSNRALIELVTSSKAGIHFDLMASLNNVKYHRCVILDGAETTSKMIYDCITKKLFEMCPSMITSTNSTQIVETTSKLIGNVSDSSIKS